MRAKSVKSDGYTTATSTLSDAHDLKRARRDARQAKRCGEACGSVTV